MDPTGTNLGALFSDTRDLEYLVCVFFNNQPKTNQIRSR